MRDHRIDSEAVLCFACSEPVEAPPHRGRAWCDRCAPFVAHLRALTTAARTLQRYELSEAAAAVEASIDAIREQIRTGAAPARAVAAEWQRKEDEAERVRERGQRCKSAQEKLDALLPDLAPCEVNRHLFAQFDQVRAWSAMYQYLETTRGDETAEELLEGARAALSEAARADPSLWAKPVQLHPRRRTA